MVLWHCWIQEHIPVWTDDEDILISELGAELVKKDVPLSGFGGCTHGNLYKVNIDIGGIIYPNMHIIVNNEINATFNLILSATMFEGFIYQIDTVNHVLNIEVPDHEVPGHFHFRQFNANAVFYSWYFIIARRHYQVTVILQFLPPVREETYNHPLLHQ